MRNRVIILALLAILLLPIPVSIGQSGSFTFVNEGNVQIDEAAVRTVAQKLIDTYGADVAIYAVVTGNESDFTRRLQADGLVTLSNTNSDTFAIYIATEEQYSEVRWGSTFDRIDGASIRTKQLNPMLRERNFTQAFVDALTATHGQLSNPFYGILQFFGNILSVPEVWIVGTIFFVLFVLNKAGIIQGSGSSSSSDSWSSSSSSSWDSGSSSSSDSGGGSSGGSWSD